MTWTSSSPRACCRICGGEVGLRQRFSVLMTRPPMGVLQARLDEAHAAAPEQASLADFRADPALVAAEAHALAVAHRVLTPACSSGGAVRRAGGASAAIGWRIDLPGTTAARKGASAVREAARALELEVVLAGSAPEGPGFWDGVRPWRPGTTGWRASPPWFSRPSSRTIRAGYWRPGGGRTGDRHPGLWAGSSAGADPGPPRSCLGLNCGVQFGDGLKGHLSKSR